MQGWIYHLFPRQHGPVRKADYPMVTVIRVAWMGHQLINGETEKSKSLAFGLNRA